MFDLLISGKWMNPIITREVNPQVPISRLICGVCLADIGVSRMLPLNVNYLSDNDSNFFPLSARRLMRCIYSIIFKISSLGWFLESAST